MQRGDHFLPQISPQAPPGDQRISTTMDLASNVLSLFPSTDPGTVDEHADDHFANPFPNSGTPDDSLFFLFPSTGQAAPDADVAPIPASINHTIPDEEAEAPFVKKELGYDPFHPAASCNTALDALQVPLKKRHEILRVESVHEQENRANLMREFAPHPDQQAFYSGPGKRSRPSYTMDTSMPNFPATLHETADMASLHYGQYPEPMVPLPLSARTVPATLGGTSKPAPKTRRPAKRRKRSPRAGEKSAGSDSNSNSASDDGSPNVRKPRTMNHMKVLARSHAPEVALQPAELEEIAGMHESEGDLALSRDLYHEVSRFKSLLGRFGYRLAALTLDPLTEAVASDEPFDFVLKRKLRPVPAAAATPVAAPPGAERGGAPSAKPGAALALDGSPVSACAEPPAPRAARDARSPGREYADGATCAVCSKGVSDAETLVRHFRHAHQELKPFSCPRCKGSYSSEGTLWHHIRNVHSETPRKFRCSQCDASYDSFGAKTRHEHATHNTDTPEFGCTFDGCNRAFNFPAHLESHALHDHPGFKPFGCSECAKRFNSANGLIRHKREVHRRNRAYSCSCGTTFAKKDHLKRHLLQRHSMSYEKATEEMRKQPSPGLVHFMPPAAPAAAEAV